MDAGRLARINSYLQRQLEERNLNEVTAVEAARWLDRAGLLKDSAIRPGLPLRNLLRAGQITGQRQDGNRRWFIERATIKAAPAQGTGGASPRIAPRTPIELPVRGILEFKPLGRVGDLIQQGLPDASWLESCGVYILKVPAGYAPRFIEPEAARASGNVLFPWTVQRLKEKWVPGAEIVYIGLAGRASPRSLRKRLSDLLRHACGRTSDRGPHKGGEIVWQLHGYSELLVWAAPTAGPPVPRETEVELLEEFVAAHRMLPFGNRQR